MDLSLKMICDIPKVISHHYKEKAINWPMITYISIVHAVGLAGLFRVMNCSAETLIWAFILWPISGFGITVGVHRLWSHRSYEASFGLRSYSCFVTPLPTRDPSSTGLVITEYITNSLKLTLIHITQHVDSSLHTWDGYLSKSTLM